MDSIGKQIITIVIMYTVLSNKIGFIPTTLLIIGSIAAFSLYHVLHWSKTIYAFKEHVIIYQKGILSVKTREIPLDKINTIDISQGIFERLFNLSRVKIDTESAKTLESEMALLLTKEKALEMREKLLKHKQVSPHQEDKKTKEGHFHLSFKHLILYSFISSSIFQSFVIIWALYNLLDDIESLTSFNGFKYITQIQFSVYIVVLSLLGIFMMGLVLSLIKNCLKYSLFHVYTEDGKLHISHGLIHKKNYSFDIHKVKGVHIRQKLPMQLTKRCSIEIESMGYGDEAGERAILFPFCTIKESQKIIRDLLPEFQFQQDVDKAFPMVYARFIIKKLVITVLIASVVSYYVPYGFLSFILVLVAWLVGHMQYHNTTIAMSDTLVYMSYNGFSKKQSIIKINAIQSMKMSTTFFQKRKNICNYTINIWGKVVGKNITVKNISNRLFDNYAQKL